MAITTDILNGVGGNPIEAPNGINVAGNPVLTAGGAAQPVNATNISATGTATLATVDINGGAIDGTVIGATTPAAGTFTNLAYTGALTGALRTDAAGNAGLGVVPSAWGNGRTGFQVGNVTSLANDPNGAVVLGLNNYFNGGFVQTISGIVNPAQIVMNSEGIQLNLGLSVGAGNPIAFNRAITLMQGGNLLVGTTIENSARNRVEVGTNTYLYEGLNAGTPVNQILANGDNLNVNGVFGAISDAKLKNVIGPVASYWEKYKLIQWVKYTLKADDTDQEMLGVIAQQTREVFPGLIQETPDMVDVVKTREVTKTVPVTRTETQETTRTEIVLEDGKYTEVTIVESKEVQVPVVDEFPIYDSEGNDTGRVHTVPRTETITETEEYTEKEPNGEVTLSVKYSILGHIADVVLQEVMKRTEANEAEIEALKARIYALESIMVP